jgi:membrane peptidoglycan carboxypeptidase
VLKWLLVSGIVLVLIAVAVFFFAYQKTTIPNPNTAFQTQASYVYYANGKAKIGQFATQNRVSVPLSDMSKHIKDAVVAAEDRTFWTNNGIDPKGIIRAAFSNAQGNPTQGASTITQQYVKILYLSQQRTLSRKVKEAFLSLKIQQQQSKQEILQGYLNTIYFGRGAYGVQAASQSWFGIDAKRLNVKQAAFLAAILNSPTAYDPDLGTSHAEALLQHYSYVLHSMAQMGMISAGRADRASQRLPKLVKQKQTNAYGGQRGFMLSMVKNRLRQLGFSDEQIDGGGLRVTTTFRPSVMAADKQAVLGQRPPGLRKLHVGVASVDTHTGALLGFYGGQNYLKSQLNWATLSDSPGSAFKPFALAAGLKAGFSLKDTFDGNSPYTYPDGSTVVNEGPYGGNDYGSSVSLLYGLEQSINTVFADLTESMPSGPERIRRTAVEMGVPDSKDLKPTAGIALGSAGISPVNLANAYSTIADGGKVHHWFFIKKITRASDGKVLYANHPKAKRAVSNPISRDVSYAMQQVVQHGTGMNALALGRPAAGKTGTATDDKGHVITSWFSGFTPQVATAVMYVRGDGRQPLEGYLPSYFGADYPTLTWTAAMKKIMASYPVQSFPPAAFVDGTAPSPGHAPYTPPPPSPTTHSPRPKPSPTPTHKPSPTPTPTPTPSPTPSPSQSPSPSILPSQSPSSSNNGNGQGGPKPKSGSGG